MRSSFAVVALALTLGACQQTASPVTQAAAAMTAPNASEAAKAKAAVSRVLKDPASAQFEGLFTHPGAVCGFVNARNSFGGYTGRRPFGYIIAQDVAYVLEPSGRTDHHSIVTQYCVR